MLSLCYHYMSFHYSERNTYSIETDMNSGEIKGILANMTGNRILLCSNRYCSLVMWDDFCFLLYMPLSYVRM